MERRTRRSHSSHVWGNRIVVYSGLLVLGLLSQIAEFPTVAEARAGPKEVPIVEIAQPFLEIFMSVSATPAQVSAVEAKIRSMSTVSRFAFLDHNASLREFRKIFHDNPGLLRTITAADLPVTFRLHLVHDSDASRVTRALRSLSGVEEVNFGPPKKPTLAQQRQEIAECKVRDFDIEVFMRVAATQDQINQVRAAIASEANVELVRFMDHDAALAKFQQLFRNDPKTLSKVQSGTDLPESFELGVPKARQSAVTHDLYRFGSVDYISGTSAICVALRAQQTSHS